MIRCAIDAGIKTVILPAENERDVQNLPEYIRKRVQIEYVSDIQQVINLALLEKPAHPTEEKNVA